MPATEAQVRANRTNCRRSTGPRDTSMTKYNAYRHGLAARFPSVPRELELLGLLIAALKISFRPRTPKQHDLVEDIAACRHRINCCRANEAAARERLQGRSRGAFDADRREEMNAIARRLAKTPGLMVARLRTSGAGCNLLIERWETLARLLEAWGAWTDPQRHEAFDLLGIPASCREGNPLMP
jgi:hypothetical protein